MINVRPVRLSDFETVKMSDKFSAFTMQYLLRHGISVMMYSRSAMTMEVDGKPLAICDTFPYNGGLYMWALIDKDIAKYGLAPLRILRRSIGMFRGVDLWAHAKGGDDDRLLTSLGFSKHRRNDVEFKGERYDLYSRAV